MPLEEAGEIFKTQAVYSPKVGLAVIGPNKADKDIAPDALMVDL